MSIIKTPENAFILQLPSECTDCGRLNDLREVAIVHTALEYNCTIVLDYTLYRKSTCLAERFNLNQDCPVKRYEIRYADGSSAVPEPRELAGYDSRILSKPTVWTDELAQDYPGYEVLVQLEEDDDIGLRFYDCGTLFFLIRPEDLAARRFDQVRCVLYSY